MDCKTKMIFDMKLNKKLSNMFCGIIKDIPICENRRMEIVSIKKGEIISYKKFYEILYNSVLEYVPKEDENPLIKAIKMLPKAKSNMKRLLANKEIINLQKEILNKYFYQSGDQNIKEKINELKAELNDLVEEGSGQIVDSVLERFEGRIRDGFLKDMQKLELMIENRK